MRNAIQAVVLGILWGMFVLVGMAVLRPGFLQLDSASDWGLSALALAVLAVPAAMFFWILLHLGWSRRFLGKRTAMWIPLGLIGCLLVLRLLTGFLGSSSRGDGPGVVILGLDGAGWPIIDRLIESGELPNFDRLKREGASGVFRSDEPTLSPRVWTTIATGVDPVIHGATDFFSTQDSIQEPRIWEIVSLEGGKTIGVWEWLLTWPPAQLDGFIVPGWLTRGVETQPAELEFFQRFRKPGPEDAGLLGKLRLAMKLLLARSAATDSSPRPRFDSPFGDHGTRGEAQSPRFDLDPCGDVVRSVPGALAAR